MSSSGLCSHCTYMLNRHAGRKKASIHLKLKHPASLGEQDIALREMQLLVFVYLFIYLFIFVYLAHEQTPGQRASDSSHSTCSGKIPSFYSLFSSHNA